MVFKRLQLIDRIVAGRKDLQMYDAEAEAFLGEILAIQSQLDSKIEKQMCNERERAAKMHEQEIHMLLTAAEKRKSQGQDLEDTTQTTLAQLANEERD